MKINVKVKLKSKLESIETIDEQNYIVKVNAKPVDGEANTRVQELLSHYFKCPKSHVKLLKGHKSKLKVFEIIPKN
jgi:uncharacterized protein (TIGR00251 family)